MEKIFELLRNGNTKESINAAFELPQVKANQSFETALIVINADYSTFELDNIKGVLEEAYKRIRLNSLVDRMLSLLRLMQDEEPAKPRTEPDTIAACKAAQTLMVYLSEKENDKTIYVKREDGNWFLRKAQGEEYINKLSDIYLTQGHGLFMPKAIRDNLYTFRSFVFRILDHARHHNTEGDMIPLLKKQIPEKLVPQLRTNLIKDIKAVL